MLQVEMRNRKQIHEEHSCSGGMKRKLAAKRTVLSKHRVQNRTHGAVRGQQGN